MLVIDRLAFSDPQHPILVVDLLREPGRTFRAIPPEVGAIADNLELANMDFCDFVDTVDEDGTFRGFPEMPQLPPVPQPSFWKRLFQ